MVASQQWQQVLLRALSDDFRPAEAFAVMLLVRCDQRWLHATEPTSSAVHLSVARHCCEAWTLDCLWTAASFKLCLLCIGLSMAKHTRTGTSHLTSRIQ